MELICIRCPMGCSLQVELREKEVLSVRGNSCPRGEEYARTEAVAPRRTVTSTVRIIGGSRPVAAVKTIPEIPKDKIFAVMEAIRALTIEAPVRQGDVLLHRVANTDADLVATVGIESA